ncbi:MAG: hypothetical protein NZ777_14285 [Pseudomonadales bacterium]|jgi:hypothetical protein|nr:hypothetical protein [Pseudomonadales bacterium]|tara:strand:- start:1861 stop:2067 length:207 start_codon:yes stop_codon:yes gene_type:complete
MSSKAIRDQQALKAPLGQSDYKVPRVMLVTLGLMDAKAVEASQEKLEKMERMENQAPRDLMVLMGGMD